MAVEAVHHPVAIQGDQFHRAGLARLEAHGGAGGDVEPIAPRLRPVKIQGGVGFGKVVVGTHLNGPVAGIGHDQAQGGTANIELQLAVGEESLRDFSEQIWQRKDT